MESVEHTGQHEEMLRLLRENNDLLKENNEMLRAARRHARWGLFYKMLSLIFFVVVPFIAYFMIMDFLQPYLGMLGAGSGASGTGSGVDVNDLLKAYGLGG